MALDRSKMPRALEIGEKSYNQKKRDGYATCPFCAFTTESKYNLVRHLCTHTKEYPFYCRLPFCDASYGGSSGLAAHLNAHIIRREITTKRMKGTLLLSFRVMGNSDAGHQTWQTRLDMEGNVEAETKEVEERPGQLIPTHVEAGTLQDIRSKEILIGAAFAILEAPQSRKGEAKTFDPRTNELDDVMNVEVDEIHVGVDAIGVEITEKSEREANSLESSQIFQGSVISMNHSQYSQNEVLYIETGQPVDCEAIRTEASLQSRGEAIPIEAIE